MSAAVAQDSLVGFVLEGKYRVLRQIGRGGMGIVYEAEHVGIGKRVAVKLMLEKYSEDAEAIRRFQREAIAASRVGNAHIIDVSDIGTAPDGRAFVVMELLDGVPLSKIIEAVGPMSPWRAIQIIRQVLRGVGAAHAKGIIHRDLKPDNIFLVNHEGEHDFVKLLDFGISKVVDPDEEKAMTKLTTTGVVMGTPLYMAPEQAMGHVTDRYADLYAVGVILYEMLAGRPPFEGQTYAVLVAKVLTEEPKHLDDVRPGLPPALVRATHRALAKEPERRFGSAEAFATALPGDRSPSQIELAGTLDSGMGISAVSVARPGARWPWIAMVVALLAGAAATAGVLMSQRGPAEPAGAGAPAAGSAAAPFTPPATGLLEIKTTPPGARVMIDGKPEGTTPLVITLLPGPHQVRLELDGHEPSETEQVVNANGHTALVVPLGKAAPAAPGADRPDKAGKADRPGKPDKRGARPVDAAAAGAAKTVKPPPGPATPGEPATPYDVRPAPPPAPTPPAPPPPRPPGGEKTKPNPY